jgi:quinolinate synthase
MDLSNARTPSSVETLRQIGEARARLGEDLCILVHHYERDEVVRFADVVGDSLELSRQAAAQERARYIVFCGVDFMAETAAMLCRPEQTVLIPEPSARCPMAAMVDVEDAALAYERLHALWGGDLLPITYQNSDAQVKALCGRHGGAVCTSANAQKLFGWALAQRGHLLFFPDEHLGTNSALALGVGPAEIAVWDPRDPEASLERASGARVVVWRGYCHVHTHFTPDDVLRVRREHPSARVIVHPECPAPVVQAADGAGSTATSCARPRRRRPARPWPSAPRSIWSPAWRGGTPTRPSSHSPARSAAPCTASASRRCSTRWRASSPAGPSTSSPSTPRRPAGPTRRCSACWTWGDTHGVKRKT